MKYTAGPWTIAAGPTYCAIRTDARVIADMRLVGLHYNKADAALIAAAPDLLNAVRFLLSNPDNHISKADRDAAYAAITKATGAA